MILLFIWIYIYIEKKVFYNIEGQLRGFQLSDQPKTCAPNFRRALCTSVKHLYPRKALKKLPPSSVTRAAKLANVGAA